MDVSTFVAWALALGAASAGICVVILYGFDAVAFGAAEEALYRR
jgi:hypothetical protein